MTPREFAIDVVEKLQQAGFEALWAGGCVRDQLMDREPKDYDVATNALPDQVRELFGKKRTLPIGVSFGVITVRGPKSAGMVEVATFRRDSGYSDGRRPDSVEFTDAREDALRRDFTINGMFFDPTSEEVIDYVGGRDDLIKRKIRAIGNPHQRIEEDKLRMLRGIRFAATFDFELESETLAAIQKHAPEIDAVSGERIGAELRRMLTSPNRAVAIRLLRQSGLMMQILPAGEAIYANQSDWEQALISLERLGFADFESAAALLLEPIVASQGVGEVVSRWKLSNDERGAIKWICQHWKTLDRAHEMAWSVVQPLLLDSNVQSALAVADAKRSDASEGVLFCRERLTWPTERLNPQPLLDGADLFRLGIEQGPKFKLILEAVRTSQLDGEIETVQQAEALALGFEAEE